MNALVFIARMSLLSASFQFLVRFAVPEVPFPLPFFYILMVWLTAGCAVLPYRTSLATRAEDLRYTPSALRDVFADDEGEAY